MDAGALVPEVLLVPDPLAVKLKPVYPVPPFTNVKPVTAPPLTVAIKDAPVPIPDACGVTVTDGTAI